MRLIKVIQAVKLEGTLGFVLPQTTRDANGLHIKLTENSWIHCDCSKTLLVAPFDLRVLICEFKVTSLAGINSDGSSNFNSTKRLLLFWFIL